ncbi:MAG: alpha/beta fold hydrolase [Solirubrobacterales bacterium]|nr:alpha/beta fold hydrolase [Solirubrobacterales bacterium]MBV9715434.1 alpha/beta fold hydrolase [Solirubrobacterales bacterium]
MPRSRPATVARPAETGVHDGLAYAMWHPDAGRAVRGGVVILHGAGSAKESHYDFARLVRSAGYLAIAFDLRGHGESDGPLDGRALGDVAAMAALLRSRLPDPRAPLVLRGSSMGGYLALLAASRAGAAAVVAICPAEAAGLRRGLRGGALHFTADEPALDAFFAEHDLAQAVGRLEMPLLLLHAEGDERVPVEHSRALAGLAPSPESRLITVPGGHHRSVQHDPELQAASLSFIERVTGAA